MYEYKKVIPPLEQFHKFIDHEIVLKFAAGCWYLLLVPGVHKHPQK